MPSASSASPPTSTTASPTASPREAHPALPLKLPSTRLAPSPVPSLDILQTLVLQQELPSTPTVAITGARDRAKCGAGSCNNCSAS